MKRIISCLMVVILTLTIGFTSHAGGEGVGLGDFVKFGTYKNQALIWQVVHIDQSGKMTFYAANIIDKMVFDAAEGGLAGEGENVSARNAYGSNLYKDSNIHEWLNSDERVVTYTTQAPDSDSILSFADFDDVVESGVLSNDPGFLSAFSSQEKSVLEAVTFEVGTPYIDGGYEEANGALLDIGETTTIKSNKTYEMTAKVFLLSLNEWVDQVKNNGFDLVKNATDGAEYYWLRTPDEQSETLVATIDTSGDLFKTSASFAKTGIVPGIKVDVSKYELIDGDGSISNPYILDLSYANLSLEDVEESTKNPIIDAMEAYGMRWTNLPYSQVEADIRAIEGEVRASDEPGYTRAVYYSVAKDLGIYLPRQLFLESRLLSEDVVEPVSFWDIGDLSNDDQAAINRMAELGVINGYLDGSFRPGNSVIRTELAKMMTVLMQKSDNILDKSFVDVNYGDWFYGYVENARDLQLIRGVGDGYYLPNKTLTRDELAVIVARVLKYHYGFKNNDALEALSNLSDTSTVASWAQDDVALLAKVEVISKGEVHIGNKEATRLEVVTMLDRLKNLIYE